MISPKASTWICSLTKSEPSLRSWSVHSTTYISLASLVLAVFSLGWLRILTELVGLNKTRKWKCSQLRFSCHWKRPRLHLSNSSGWQCKEKLFSWNYQDFRYSRLLERHPIITNSALRKRLDLGHDPEPIVVNGSLFPLTSAGFGSGLYFLKWTDSLQVCYKQVASFPGILEDAEDDSILNTSFKSMAVWMAHCSWGVYLRNKKKNLKV